MIKFGGKEYRNLPEQVAKNANDIEAIKKALPYPSEEYYNKEEADEKFETKEDAFSGSYNDLDNVPTYYVYSLQIRCVDTEVGYEYYLTFQTIPTSEDLGNIGDHPEYEDIIKYLFLKQVGYDEESDQVCIIDNISTTELSLRKYDGTAYSDDPQAGHIKVTIKDKKVIA